LDLLGVPSSSAEAYKGAGGGGGGREGGKDGKSTLSDILILKRPPIFYSSLVFI